MKECCKNEIRKMLDKIQIDENLDGKIIESMAEQFGVPVSIMAIRLLDIKKDEIKELIN